MIKALPLINNRFEEPCMANLQDLCEFSGYAKNDVHKYYLLHSSLSLFEKTCPISKRWFLVCRWTHNAINSRMIFSGGRGEDTSIYSMVWIPARVLRGIQSFKLRDLDLSRGTDKKSDSKMALCQQTL